MKRIKVTIRRETLGEDLKGVILLRARSITGTGLIQDKKAAWLVRKHPRLNRELRLGDVARVKHSESTTTVCDASVLDG